MKEKLLESVQKKVSSWKKHQIIAKFQERILNDPFSDQLLKKLEEEDLSIASSFIDTLKLSKNYLPEWTKRALSSDYFDGMVTYLHNAGFRETHLRDGNSLKNLELHLPGEMKKEWLPEKFLKYLPEWIASQLITYIMQLRYNPQFISMSQQEEQLLVDCLSKVEKGKSTIIISNHDTFGNLPMIILKLMIVAKKLGMKNINKHIYTIIGPLLDTHKWQRRSINALSNTIITQPADNNPEELKEVYKEQRALARETILTHLQQGIICILAPSGTRDIVVWKKDWIVKLYLPEESHISNRTSFGLIREIAKQDLADVLLVGVNSTELKRGISPSNNDWNRNAPIEMHIKDISHKKDIETKETLSDLKSLITHNGKEIAEHLPYQLFKIVKKLQKAGMLQDYLQEDGDIDLKKIEKQYLPKS